MIKSEKGEIIFEGDLSRICVEVTILLKHFREILTNELGEECANIMFAEIGRASCMDADELLSEETLNETKKRIRENLENEICG